MNRNILLLLGAATGAIAFCVIFLLRSDNNNASSIASTALLPIEQLRKDSPEHRQSDERIETKHREAEHRAQELEQELAESRTNRSERAKRPPMADPEMKKVLKSEASSATERSVAALFDAGLAKHLKLSDEQREELRALLVERGSIAWEQIFIPMAAGELDGARLAAAGKNVKQAYLNKTAQIRALLGNEGFAAFEWYEKTQPDRDCVKHLTPRFAKAGFDLSDDQQSRLVSMMIQERANFPFEHSLPEPMDIDYGRFHEIFSAENADRHFRETEKFNEHLVQRAHGTLTPDQVLLFQELLNAQLQRAKLTVRTTMAMMPNQR